MVRLAGLEGGAFDFNFLLIVIAGLDPAIQCNCKKFGCPDHVRA